MKKIFTFIILSLVCNFSHGELVWSEDTGWQMKIKGGTLSHIYGESIDGNAIELMNAAKRADIAGNHRKALNIYDQVKKKYHSSELAPEALYQSGKIRAHRHQYADSFEDFEAIVTNYPNYPKFNKVIGEQFKVATELMEGRRPRYFGLIPGFRSYKDAHEYFERVVKNAPNSEYAPMALINIATLADKNGKKEDAIDALDRLISDYPQSILAQDAYLKLAKTYESLVKGPSYDQASTLKSISYYEDFLNLFPKSPNIHEAEHGLIRMQTMLSNGKLDQGNFYYKKRHNPEAALIFYNAAITAAPLSEPAKTARIQIEKINNKVPPPKGPVDFLFGPYDKEKGY